MSKADEMFEKLGYEKVLETEHHIQYAKEEYYICFNVFHKTVTKIEDNVFNGKITLQELQAINEKCKELGWL